MARSRKKSTTKQPPLWHDINTAPHDAWIIVGNFREPSPIEVCYAIWCPRHESWCTSRGESKPWGWGTHWQEFDAVKMLCQVLHGC